MSKSRRQKSENRKARIERRLDGQLLEHRSEPMLSASNIHYELADRSHGLSAGGIGLIHQLARKLGLMEAINERVVVLKVHMPYHESDHVLNIAYNILMGGCCLEDIELRRNDEVFLDALGAERIPDPTTAGDFCRRFLEADINDLMDAINISRVRVWREQPDEFFDRAILDADGTISETQGECKQGSDIAYDGTFGYQTLVISLANTQEPLYVETHGANRPSREGAAARFDQAIDLCRGAGFRQVLLRGDTAYSQCAHLDRWDAQEDLQFLFGLKHSKPLYELAGNLPESAWKGLKRSEKYEVKTEPRARPENVKDRVVRERGFTNIRLNSEMVAEFHYQPTACAKPYRIIALRKNLTISRGEDALLDDIKIFFFITNDEESSPAELVLCANQRCNQENLCSHLKSGVHALKMPLGDLNSNWAYSVMAGLAWSLKSWFALHLRAEGRWKEQHAEEKQEVLSMEFRSFLNAFMLVPCQIVKTGRRIVYRLLSWNRWQRVFLRAATTVTCPLRC